jgi:hypothetical protein
LVMGRREGRRAVADLCWEVESDTNGPKVAHSYDSVRLRYRRQVFGALAFWTPTYAPPAFAPKNMQPEALSLEMIRRSATAIADLDSFRSLEESE